MKQLTKKEIKLIIDYLQAGKIMARIYKERNSGLRLDRLQASIEPLYNKCG